jgi:roadblock/LC7 domain-containing protein
MRKNKRTQDGQINKKVRDLLRDPKIDAVIQKAETPEQLQKLYEAMSDARTLMHNLMTEKPGDVQKEFFQAFDEARTGGEYSMVQLWNVITMARMDVIMKLKGEVAAGGQLRKEIKRAN